MLANREWSRRDCRPVRPCRCGARLIRNVRQLGQPAAGTGLVLDEVSMKIDIDKLTEAELVDLNNRIVERLRFLTHMRAHAQMLEFKIGDRVSFQPAALRSWLAWLRA